MSKIGPVLSLLRENTGEVHRRLEDRMDAISRLSRPADRDDLVRRYHRFHWAMEMAMTSGLADLDAGDWRRASRIGHSLDILALSPLPARPIPIFDSQQALGALYVLEGSALGGRVILKDLAGRGADLRGLQFLDPHGEMIGDRWRTVTSLIERETSAPDRVVDGAIIAFEQAHDMLCLEGAVA
jgi:heme oxygenase